MPLDFCFWGYLKDQLYPEKPKTIAELKQVIVDKISAIPLDMCANVCNSVTTRLRRMIDLNDVQYHGQRHVACVKMKHIVLCKFGLSLCVFANKFGIVL